MRTICSFWGCLKRKKFANFVVPAKAGTHVKQKLMDFRFRGNDKKTDFWDSPSIKTVRVHRGHPVLEPVASKHIKVTDKKYGPFFNEKGLK